MSRAVVVVWLGVTSLRTPHEPDLASWANARQVTLEDVAADAPLPNIGHDDALASKLEALIAEALAVGEASEAASVLTSAEALLRSHAELPQSAWLMAEILHARVALGVVEGADAIATERRAAALEGTREAPYDPGSGAKPKGADARRPEAPDAASPEAEEPLRFGVDGPLPTDDVYIDGVRGIRATVSSGEHHYRVVRRDGLAWAGWADAAGVGQIRVPGTQPCSATDLGAVDESEGRILLHHRVLCPEWAAARTRGDERIEVARCHGSSCGTFLPWRRQWGASFEMPVHPPWPAPKRNDWIFWTAASIAAAATTGIVLWQAGLFEKEPEKVPVIIVQTPSGPSAGK
jgi:hypothetical protein